MDLGAEQILAASPPALVYVRLALLQDETDKGSGE
jgi:hypothetical protein